jgi:hypothetical protein
LRGGRFAVRFHVLWGCPSGPAGPGAVTSSGLEGQLAMPWVHDVGVSLLAVRAGVVAALVSGVPSTLHALLTRRDPLAAAKAAGGLVLPRESRGLPLLVVAVPVHLGISVGWALVLERVLPRRWGVGWGAVAGALIAFVDLRVPGRRTAAVRRLVVWPQVADHVLFGAVVGGYLRVWALRLR